MQVQTETPRYFALDIAHHFLDAAHTNADDHERDRLQSLVLCAGQHLDDCGHPGAWHTFDPASFLERMPETGPQRVLLCIDLAGLFGWLGIHELLATRDAARILANLQTAGPREPAFQNLCKEGRRVLTSLAAAAPKA